MQHPLRSLTPSPDSSDAVPWDEVDREIERLAREGREMDEEARKATLAAASAAEVGSAPSSSGIGEQDERDDGSPLDDVQAEDEVLVATLDRRSESGRRIIMLACACCLSIGSHYATYDLGPIKTSLGTSESSFAGFVSAIELANTVTPLVSGFLVPKLGAATCGLVATGLVLVGQLVVYVAQSREGGAAGNPGWMVLGLLIFGSGTSPLAVVQESIILRHNDSSSKFVARSVAAGLVLGKAGSFAGAWSSEPLFALSPRLPFVIASTLSLFSLSASALYALVNRHNMRRREPLAEKADRRHGHALRLSALAYFGSPFWWYMAVCALAGMWYTTEHLSSQLLQTIYAIPESAASPAASLVLGTPLLCYPLLGYLIDRRPTLLDKFWIAVPSLISLTYLSYLLLGPVIPPILAILPAAFGVGSGTLLLVLVVPRIVQPEQAATALGAHKSIEMAGAIIVQTFAGRLFSAENASWVISFLLGTALLQIAVVVRWWHSIRKRSLATGKIDQDVALEEEETHGLLPGGGDLDGTPGDHELMAHQEYLRGRKCLWGAGAVVVVSWICFLSNVV